MPGAKSLADALPEQTLIQGEGFERSAGESFSLWQQHDVRVMGQSWTLGLPFNVTHSVPCTARVAL